MVVLDVFGRSHSVPAGSSSDLPRTWSVVTCYSDFKRLPQYQKLNASFDVNVSLLCTTFMRVTETTRVVAIGLHFKLKSLLQHLDDAV